MRSRYSAYALGGLGEYLLETWHPQAPEVEHLSVQQLSTRDVDWQTLDVLDNRENGDKAMVEFRASFRLPAPEKPLQTLRERSRFVRENGRWYYTKGDIIDETLAAHKPGRNDPCPCNSGKKYKRCCGR